MLYKVVLTFESVDEILKCDHSNESYWAVLSCGAVYYVLQSDHSNPSYWTVFYHGTVYYAVQGRVLISESVDGILESDHSNESYRAALSCGAVYYAIQGGSNFWVCGWNPKVWPFKWKLLSSTFLRCCLFWCQTWWIRLHSFWVCGWFMKDKHSSLAPRSWNTVKYVLQAACSLRLHEIHWK